MARRGFPEARNLFYLLTRTDSTFFGDSEVADFLEQSLKAYWDVFVIMEARTQARVKASDHADRDSGPQGYQDALYEPITFLFPVLGITGAYRQVDAFASLGTEDGDRVVPIERVEFDEMRRRQLADTSTGVPEAWAAVRGEPELSAAESNDVWSIYIHPKPVITSDTYLWITYREGINPSFNINTVELGAITDAEFFWVVQMAAARASFSVGRLDDVPLIVQGVPDAVLLRAAIDLHEAIPEMSEASSG